MTKTVYPSKYLHIPISCTDQKYAACYKTVLKFILSFLESQFSVIVTKEFTSTRIKKILNVFIQNLENEKFHLFIFHLLIVKSNHFPENNSNLTTLKIYSLQGIFSIY